MDSSEMFRKIVKGQGFTQEFLTKHENKDSKVVEVTKLELIKSALVAIDVIVNMMIDKKICTKEELISMHLFISEAFEGLFEEDDQ